MSIPRAAAGCTSSYLVDRLLSAKVIDVIGHGNEVESCEHLFAPWIATGIVVIPMNGEYGQVYAVVGIEVVDLSAVEISLGVAEQANLDGVGAHAVPAHNFHGLVHCVPTGAVLVEEISGDENHIAIEFLSQIEDLFKGREGVVACVMMATAKRG